MLTAHQLLLDNGPSSYSSPTVSGNLTGSLSPFIKGCVWFCFHLLQIKSVHANSYNGTNAVH